MLTGNENWWFLLSPVLPMSVTSISDFPQICQLLDQLLPYGNTQPPFQNGNVVNFFGPQIRFFMFWNLRDIRSRPVLVKNWRIFISAFQINYPHKPPVWGDLYSTNLEYFRSSNLIQSFIEEVSEGGETVLLLYYSTVTSLLWRGELFLHWWEPKSSNPKQILYSLISYFNNCYVNMKYKLWHFPSRNPTVGRQRGKCEQVSDCRICRLPSTPN